jgi:acetyl esterase/lipase
MRLLLFLPLFLPGSARAQLSEKPETWTRLEGHFLRPAPIDEASYLGIVLRGVLSEARRDQKIPPETVNLRTATAQAFNVKNFNAAWRLATRLAFVTRGTPLSEALDVAASYDFQLDRRIVAPGEGLHAVLDPLYTLDRPLKDPLTVQVTLESPTGQVVHSAKPLVVESVEPHEFPLPTRDLAPGRYVVRYGLVDKSGKPVVAVGRDLIVDATLKAHLDELKSSIGKIALAETPGRSAQQQAAFETAMYIHALLSMAKREYVGSIYQGMHPMTLALGNPERLTSDPIDIERDLQQADTFASALMKGDNPLAGLKGDLRLAYRSSVDRSFQPYHVFLPSTDDPAVKFPMVIALHGSMADQDTYFDAYRSPLSGHNLFRELGEQRGYILACPNGRGPMGGYIGASERDVLDVLDRVASVFSADPGKVFLMGEHMGGFGTLQIGLTHPERFAALASVAGLVSTTLVTGRAAGIPVLLCQGAKDTLGPPELARLFARAVERQSKVFKYVETPNDDQQTIGIATLKMIFDFFDAVRNPPAKAVTAKQ